jgi:hypothetical protein
MKEHVGGGDAMEEDDAPVGDLVKFCDESPREGLEWISSLEGELAQSSLVLFAKFIALRHLVLDTFFAHGGRGFHDLPDDDLADRFTSEQLDHAQIALETIAIIERSDPSYLAELNTDGSDWAFAMVDSVATPLERLRPGSVQKILGWTKLSYLGTDRVGFAPNLLGSIPQDLIKAIVNTRISHFEAFKSVVAVSWSDDPQQHIAFQMFAEDYNYTPTLGDAGMLSILAVFEDGRVENLDDRRSETRDGLDHPNRDHLMAEAEMLLRYETNEDRRRYLEQMIEWLNGRGMRPEKLPEKPVENENSVPWGRLAIAFILFLAVFGCIRDILSEFG